MRTLFSTRRRPSLIAGAVVLALGLAACGGDDDDDTSTAESPAATGDSELAAMVPDAIKEDGVITVGTDASYAPNEFLDTDGATVIGWDVELFDAVAAKLGLETEWENGDFDAIIPGVQSGRYEIGVSSFTINPDRLEQAEMISYFNAGTQWAVQSGNPADVDPDNACGKKVAVQADTVQHTDDLPVRDQACTSAGNPAITIEPYQGQDEATALSSRARTTPCSPTRRSWPTRSRRRVASSSCSATSMTRPHTATCSTRARPSSVRRSSPRCRH